MSIINFIKWRIIDKKRQKEWRKKNSHNSVVLNSFVPFDCIQIGKYTYGELNILRLDDSSNLTIGSLCSIAENVTFLLAADHGISRISTFPFKAKMLKETENEALSKGDIVVYESTVYPGVTEDECIPVVEKISRLKYNVDFFAGYSPERINPGDKLHTVEKIKKVTSGSTPDVAQIVNEVYASVITAGTHLAPTIKVAEAAKVIENSQRDINIAFVNELSKIFTRMGIDTQQVLEAASTKWNFLPFKPGLVGGHCIGVDPYYLAQCAQRFGYNPEIILAGRRMNDGMGEYVANQIVKLMLKKGIQVLNSNILILGFTFKENCPDVRNTKVIDIYNALKEYNLNITVYDPWASQEIVKREYEIEVINTLPQNKYEAVVLAVAHQKFDGLDIKYYLKDLSVVYDVKGFLPEMLIDGRL